MDVCSCLVQQTNSNADRLIMLICKYTNSPGIKLPRWRARSLTSLTDWRMLRVFRCRNYTASLYLRGRPTTNPGNTCARQRSTMYSSWHLHVAYLAVQTRLPILSAGNCNSCSNVRRPLYRNTGYTVKYRSYTRKQNRPTGKTRSHSFELFHQSVSSYSPGFITEWLLMRRNT